MTTTTGVMSVTDFARAYGFSASTVYNMISNGELGCIRRDGSAIRILPRHAQEWENRYECPARKQQTPHLDSSEFQGDGLGISAGLSQEAAAARLSAQGRRMRRKLGLSSLTGG